jgi:hypothetical protein
MNPKLNGKDIRQLLNRSAAGLEASTVQKLDQARVEALDHFEAMCADPALALAGMGRQVSGPRQKIYRWLAILLLAASLAGAIGYYWQQSSEHDSGDDIDIAILTDDMPMDAYVD